MPILHRDIETRSTLRLADVGAWRYAADPSTGVLCIGYAIDDAPVRIWTPDQPIPEEFHAAARDPDWLVAAHNDQFESAIEERLLHPRYRWPLVPVERCRCTMATALANALPGSLEGAALGLSLRKDAEGRRLMQQMSRPRRPQKSEDASLIYWYDSPERRLRLQAYCRRDVEIERAIYHRLPPLSADEQRLWELDATVNRRGFHVDLALAEATLEIVREEQAAIDAEVAKLTGGRITSVNQVGRLQAPEDEAGRQIGKLCDLAFGYGGGLGAYRRIAPDSGFTDPQIENFKLQWRAAHPAICTYWRGLHNALRLALTSGKPMKFGNLSAEMRAGNLYLTLPSGRRLAYPEARLAPGKFGPQITFKDNARGAWSDARGWHGVFVENVVQAISRDLLAAAMMRLEAAGYPVVLHCHDEIVCEVPEGFDGVEHFVELMTALPAWAAGLPLAAKGWARECYAKPTQPSLPAPPDPEKPKASGFPAPIAPAPAAIIPNSEPAEAIPLADLIGEPLRDGKLNCPFHADDTPSLHVYADHFHCFGCGAHGDHVDWLMLVEGKNRDQAVRTLANWDGPTARPRPAAEDEEEKRRLALQFWQEARPIAGTLAARYLAEVRRIDIAALPDSVDDVLRFHPCCPFGAGVRKPCLVALLRDVVTDAPLGIHRVALTPDADRIERRMLGSAGAVKLWPAGSRLIVGEGIETVLAAATRLTHHGAPMRPAWSAVSSTFLNKLPIVPGVERLIVLVDHDLNGAGQAAAMRCAERWSRAGRTVIKLMPKRPGADFNDVVREGTA